ncbi:MAG: UvrD-helicase domain-containing protein, partial [Nitrospirales bacterium]
HTLGRETAPHSTQVNDLMDIAVNFECEPDDQWQNTVYHTEYVVKMALEAMQKASEVQSGETIDFADMIFLPVRNAWMTKQADLVVVDEAQDMTTAQLEIAEGICNGRICIVGDDRQAIYGFRGADSGSLDRLKRKLNAAELGLTMTYRCGQSIVRMAQSLVPDFEAAETNAEGEVLDLGIKDLVACAAPGDFLLSRYNAPLVKSAMALLKAHKRARIAGKDIGYGLVKIVRKLAKGRAATSVPEFLGRVKEWEGAETMRLQAAKKESKAAEVGDQADMLIELSEGATTVQQIIDAIESLFTDDGLGQAGVITCSSVHRAKGLEARRVFVLWETMKNHNMEEENIQYVAITRAKDSLILVRG